MEGQMSEPMWKREDGIGTQPMPSWAMYAEAVNKFSGSATAFMEHVHLLTEARSAYQEAMAVGTELRNRLDAGDRTLRGVMTKLENVVQDHLSGTVPDRKKPELVRSEPSTPTNDSTGTGRNFP
jgi:hypothetical protein